MAVAEDDIYRRRDVNVEEGGAVVLARVRVV